MGDLGVIQPGRHESRIWDAVTVGRPGSCHMARSLCRRAWAALFWRKFSWAGVDSLWHCSLCPRKFVKNTVLLLVVL